MNAQWPLTGHLASESVEASEQLGGVAEHMNVRVESRDSYSFGEGHWF